MRKYLVFMIICIIIGVLLLDRDTHNMMEENKINKQAIMTKNISKKEEVGFTNHKERTLAEITLENGNEAKLVYNGDVHLRVNEEDVMINSRVTEDRLFGDDKSGLPNTAFTLEEIVDNRLLCITEYSPSMKYNGAIPTFYKINDDSISKVWTHDVIDFDLIKVDEEELEIACSIISNPVKLKLQEDEKQEVIENLKSLEKKSLLDESYWMNIKDNLLCARTGCNWLDIEGDGVEEMILSIYCRTVGATPIRLREKGVIILNIVEDNIELRDIIFERDNIDDRLIPYFIGEI